MASFDDLSAEESRALEEWARGAPLSPALQSRYRQMQVLSVHSLEEIHEKVPFSNKNPPKTHGFAGTLCPLRNPQPGWRQRCADARRGLLQQALWTHARQNQQRRDLQRVLDEARGGVPAVLQPVDGDCGGGPTLLLGEAAAGEGKPPVWPIDDLWAEYLHPPALEPLDDTSPPGDDLPPLLEPLDLAPLEDDGLSTKAKDKVVLDSTEDTDTSDDSLPPLLKLMDLALGDDSISNISIDTVALGPAEDTGMSGDSSPPLLEQLELAPLEEESGGEVKGQPASSTANALKL